MNKLFTLILVMTFGLTTAQAQIDISAARNMGEGSTVTVEGIVTNGAELGIIRYLQDDTGGIAAYPGTGSTGNFPIDVTLGDRIQVSGPLKSFNGLLEIDPIESYTVMSSNNPIPAPLVGTPNDVKEENEGKLMTMDAVNFTNAGNLFNVGTHEFSKDGESSVIYIRSGHSLIGTEIPLAPVNLTGICSEFNGAHQLLSRTGADLEIASDFYINSAPVQSDLTSNGFTVSWKTSTAGSSSVRYGLSESLLDEVNDGGSTTDHSVTLTGLQPGQFYYIQAFSDNGTTEISSPVRIYSTASNSTGTMRVYFTEKVDANYSTGGYADDITPAAVEGAIIDLINSATSTIDVSVYNNNRETIVAALTEAHNNGIQVRYIADDETLNSALQNPVPPFSVLKGNAGSPLMHNKFMVIDADSQNDSWVLMGSTNWTSQNIADDYNNMVIIQDHTLARAYTMEFEEMWGSSNPTPNFFAVKFGEFKTDNTPHHFQVNGMDIESYFSPSDNTTLNIIDAIESAEDEVLFAILTFTNNELGSTILEAHQSGISVRGIIDNINDQGGEYNFLSNNGVNVTPDNTTRSTHHKYCLVDPSNTGSDPLVITGSHNWSAGADTRNDENTLIFHDATLANIFLQEFEARWCEVMGGTTCTTTSQEEVNEIPGFEASIFPNPASDRTTISIEMEERNTVGISLWNQNGQLLQTSILRNVQGNLTEPLNLSTLSAGNYLVTFQVGEQVAVKKFVKL